MQTQKVQPFSSCYSFSLDQNYLNNMKQFRQVNLILSGKYWEQLSAELFGVLFLFFVLLILCITSVIMQAKPVSIRTSVFVFLCILLAADKQHRLSSLVPIGQPDLFLTSSFCCCQPSCQQSIMGTAQYTRLLMRTAFLLFSWGAA